ncbi:transcriptional regulator domain protein [Rhodococcus sp. MTM3W5.2]|nr:transcriptional regulator domain protein [Rhodococcus sp. MTM3W5.2]
MMVSVLPFPVSPPVASAASSSGVIPARLSDPTSSQLVPGVSPIRPG